MEGVFIRHSKKIYNNSLISLTVTAEEKFEGRTVTDRLIRLSILYSEDIFSLTIRQDAKDVPNQMKQKKEIGYATGKVLRDQGLRTL